MLGKNYYYLEVYYYYLFLKIYIFREGTIEMIVQSK